MRAAEQVVRRLNKQQGHRGPDNDVVVVAGHFVLGNTRLAIQDPGPAGNQPFVSPSKRFTVVFNGEIYNWVELAQRFALDLPTRCDGAVIAHLWDQLGLETVATLRGMFAVAVADTTAEELFLARDPFGIKPLYYRRAGEMNLVFASEPRCLAMVPPTAGPTVDSIAQFLHLGALGSESSPFAGVHAVPPGATLRFSANGNVATADRRPPSPDGRVGLAEAFRDSVRLHLRSDVPTALLLSSGVDSCAIASVAHEIDTTLHCVTVEGAGALPDETRGATDAARRYNHEHTVAEARVDSDLIEAFFRSMQRPTVDGLNTFVVCRAIRQLEYKVALSGLGGDEMLGGYSHYRLLRMLPLLRFLDRVPGAGRTAGAVAGRAWGRDPDKIRRLLAKGGPRSPWAIDLLQREVHRPPVVRALTGASSCGPAPTTNSAADFEAMVNAELALYLQSTLLPDADAFSMCSSVELRVPFVDPVVYGAALTTSRELGRPLTKQVFAEAIADEALVASAKRPKLGFSLPMAQWMDSGPLRVIVSLIEDPKAPLWDWVDRNAASFLSDGPGKRWVETWSLAALNAWLMSLDDASLTTAKGRG